MLFDLVKKVKGIPLINAVPNTLSLSEDDPRIQRYLLTIDDHDFIVSLCDEICVYTGSNLDEGESDYFEGEKLIRLEEFLESELDSQRKYYGVEILQKLMDFVDRAIELKTGVVVKL